MNFTKWFSVFFFCFLTSFGSAVASGQTCQQKDKCDEPCFEKALRSYTELSGFYIALTGIYAVPTETGLGTFIHSLGYDNTEGGANCFNEPSKADYKLAGGVELGYDFADSGNKLELAYFYLHNSKFNSYPASDKTVAFGSSFFNIGIPLAPGTSFPSAYLNYTLNQADVKFGHRLITSSCFFEFTPLIGIRFASLKHDLPFGGGYIKSNYWGSGPFLGFDFIYNLYKGFLLIGQFDTALLMGDVKSSSKLNITDPATATGTDRFKSPSNYRVVSNFEGRLGLAYKYLFCNQSSLKIEAGYEVNNYISPFDMIISYYGLASTTPRISDLQTTNFAYSGPYVKLTWHM